MPESVDVPLPVIQAVVAAAEDALVALSPGSAEAVALDEAIGALARVLLRAMGMDDGEA